MKKIKLARKALGMNQSELAEALTQKTGKNVRQAQICNYENGHTFPPRNRIYALEEILGISLEDDYKKLVKNGIQEIKERKWKRNYKKTSV